MYDFTFLRPGTIAEAVEALQDDEAQALGGGQTLIPTMKQRLAAPATLVSLTNIPELYGVCPDGERLVIGAATPHAVVAREAAKLYPGLAALAGQIGDPAVRNRGTIGGSVANNDPSACYPAAVLGGNAIVRTNARDIAADGFFDGMFGTALEEGEIIVALDFPVPEVAAYVKFPQPASRFALVGAYVARFSDGVRVAITGASEEGVFRWDEAEAALTEVWSVEAVEGLSLGADGMIVDIHATSAYRAHLAGVMTRRAIASIV